MSSAGVRGGKLVFKGGDNNVDTKKKNRKKRKSPTSDDNTEDQHDERVWVRVNDVDLLDGPIFIVRGDRSLKLPILDEDDISRYGGPGSGRRDVVESLELGKSGLLKSEPTNGTQVLVLHRLFDSLIDEQQNQPNSVKIKCTLKSGAGEYLGVNKMGEVVMDAAVGLQNEWIVSVNCSRSIGVDDVNFPYFTLKNCMNGKMLAIDSNGFVRCDIDNNNSDDDNNGDNGDNGDEPDSFFDQSVILFQIFMQRQVMISQIEQRQRQEKSVLEMAEIMGMTSDLNAVRRIMAKRGQLSSKDFVASSSSSSHDAMTAPSSEKALQQMEQQYTDRYHSHSLGRKVYSHETAKSLSQARDEGRLREEMLDRRVKMKSDKYCK